MLLKRILPLCCIALAASLPFVAHAQQHARFRPATEAVFRATDAADHELYSLASLAAREYLRRSFSGIITRWQSEDEAARFIIAISGLKQNRPFAVDTAMQLLRQTGSGQVRDRLALAIARHYFVQGQLSAAIPYYESAGIANLNNVEIGDAKFELAYSYFNNRQFAQADTLFRIMKEVPGRYYSPGNYYYGLLAYNRGDYKEALRSFDRINNEPLYRPVVPYYMAEIYYFMGDRDKALSEALRLINRQDKLYYDNELHLLAAQTLFESGRYGEALPYFEHYYERTDKIRKEELYEMGYAYYRVGEWKNAIEKFKPLSAAQDSLGQTAMYLLGDCYLKTANKTSARSAFGICASMPFNPGQREAALLLHGKLSYELGYSNDAMRSINTLLSDYPDTRYANEARLLQSELYLATSNFKDAYEALATSEQQSNEYNQMLQRASYGYALQQWQAGNIAEANNLLSVALNHPEASDYTAATLFWKGEAMYRLGQHDSAVHYTRQFINAPGATSASRISSPATPAHAALTLGYASMEIKDFGAAQSAFKQAQVGGSITTGNAMLREADAYFMQKNFAKAAPLYASLATGTGSDAEYARLQSAIIAGLRGDDAEKTRLLQSILNASPQSRYAAEARYELGVAQISASKYDAAIATLQPLASDQTATYAPKALLKIGTAYQQLNSDDKALEAYRRILKDWSTSPERTDAQAAIKSIYIERNQPDAYTALLREFSLPQASDQELDAAYYNAAEVQYAGENWTAAQAGFRRYLDLYPLGAKAQRARYYLANSLYNAKSYRAARAAYDTLLQDPWNSFSEQSAIRAAELSINDTAWSDGSRYYTLLAANAANNSSKIRAYTGLMQIAAKTNNELAASVYADSLLQYAEVPSQVRDEATLHRLRQRINTNQPGNAVDSTLRLLSVSQNGLVAAEARYLSASRLLQAGKLKEAEAAASDNIKRSAAYEYWVVKTYILLGDILARQKDYFNARATYQSVAQNSKIPALRQEAARKLEELKSIEGSKLSNE